MGLVSSHEKSTEVILTPNTDLDVPSTVEGQRNARLHDCSPHYVS